MAGEHGAGIKAAVEALEKLYEQESPPPDPVHYSRCN